VIGVVVQERSRTTVAFFITNVTSVLPARARSGTTLGNTVFDESWFLCGSRWKRSMDYMPKACQPGRFRLDPASRRRPAPTVRVLWRRDQ
jgi:hypothetical protein